jgi:sterol desaturase/sphingolipid hydroxylase (fatty acid hydroxylase superfamily)
MDVSPVAYAVPVFFVLIGVEYLVARTRGMRAFGFHDAITDISCGIGSIVIGAGFKAIGLLGYTFVFTQVAIWESDASSVAWWVAAFVLVDFMYYWFHRAGHRVNLIWAGHVVHHQSEEYNLAVALRQSWYIPLVEWIFHLPLAVIGIGPVMWVTANTFNTLYQFWIHTETVRSIGPFEHVLNTPSHHRVHHGTNPEYIDRNYGGILIIWDKLFGTFEPERKPVVYGTVTPLRSWNPLWANVVYWQKIGQSLAAFRGLGSKLRVLFGPPGWTPDGVPPVPEVSREAQTKFETVTPTSLDVYVALQYVVAIVGTTAFMVVQTMWDIPRLIVLASVIVAGIIAWGGLFEGRKWGVALEATRLVAVAPLVWWLTSGSVGWTTGVGVVSLLALPWLLRMRSQLELVRVAELVPIMLFVGLSSGCCPIPVPFSETLWPALEVHVQGPDGPVEGAALTVARYVYFPHFQPESEKTVSARTDHEGRHFFEHESKREWHMPLMMHGVPGYGWQLCVEATGFTSRVVAVHREYEEGKREPTPQTLTVSMEPGDSEACDGLIGADGVGGYGEPAR